MMSRIRWKSVTVVGTVGGNSASQRSDVARLSAAPWVRPAVLALGVTDDSLFGELL